jgi:hypothetical protein
MMPFLDIAENTVDGLRKLAEDNGDYLLYIVDRNLESDVKDKLKEIKQIFPSYSYNDKDMGGDIIFKYLCLVKEKVNECKNKFYFLTWNDKEIDSLKKFLEGLCFSNDAIKRMIVKKNNYEDEWFKQLKIAVDSPLVHYIQHKHRAVFNSLITSAGNFNIAESEHALNLSKALAYVEGVKLSGRDLGKPSIDLLRILLEAFRAALKSNSNTPKYFDDSFQWLKKMNPRYNFNCGIISDWFSPSKYLGYHDNKNGKNSSNCQACLDIHGNPQRKIKWQDPAYKFEQNHEHYTHIDLMIYKITSQEIHFNQQNGFKGYRLQLVVYGICELLLFYNTKFSGIVDDKVGELRARVLCVMGILDKKPRKMGEPCVWVSVDAIKHCENYICQEQQGQIDLNEKYLSKINFKIKYFNKSFWVKHNE